MGDPGALKPSDPPWVQCVLGHKRRVPKPSMSTAERAAREVKRGAMRSKASDADGAAEEQDGAMTRGEWDCLGADGADASVGKLLCADHPGFNALTGVNPEADESVRSLIHSLRESGITTRVRKDVLKALMRHGLPRRADHAPDWIELGANAGIARDVGTIQRVFHATACEMRVLEARTAVTGLKAASKGEIRSGKTHAPGCKCIVCRIRVAKTTAADPTKVGWRDAVKAMKDGGVKDGGGDASPQGENTAASSPAADGNEDEHDEGNDDDDDDEGHDNDNDDDGNDEDEGDDEGDDAGLKKEGGDDPDGADTPVKGSQDEKGSEEARRRRTLRLAHRHHREPTPRAPGHDADAPDVPREEQRDDGGTTDARHQDRRAPAVVDPRRARHRGPESGDEARMRRVERVGGGSAVYVNLRQVEAGAQGTAVLPRVADRHARPATGIPRAR